MGRETDAIERLVLNCQSRQNGSLDLEQFSLGILSRHWFREVHARPSYDEHSGECTMFHFGIYRLSLIEGLPSKRKREQWRKKEKKESKNLLWTFFSARKNGDCSRKFRRHHDSGHDSLVCRPNGFATQDQSRKCRFPRSALQTSPYNDRKNTKVSTTCTYHREILTMRALRSSRTIECQVLLSLRTIEKRKDWIWTGFRSGPAGSFWTGRSGPAGTGSFADIMTQAMTAWSAAQTASPPKTSRGNVGFRGLPYKLHRTTIVKIQK